MAGRAGGSREKNVGLLFGSEQKEQDQDREYQSDSECEVVEARRRQFGRIHTMGCQGGACRSSRH